jgi:hypothetical protein
LQNKTAGPLPGKALVLFDQEYGMEIAVEPKDWSRLIDGLSPSSYWQLVT